LIRLEDQLAFQILDVIERAAIGVLAWLEIRNTRRRGSLFEACVIRLLSCAGEAAVFEEALAHDLDSRREKNRVASLPGPRTRSSSMKPKNGINPTISTRVRATIS